MDGDENRPPAPFIQLDFKTARGGGISVKKETIDVAKTRVSVHDDNLEPLKNLENNSNSKKNVIFSDFQTGSGRRLTVSKDLVDAESKKLATSLQPDPDSSTITQQQPHLPRSHSNSSELGSSVASLSNVRNQEPTLDSNSRKSVMISDFQTGSGRRLTVSKDLVDAECKKLATSIEPEAMENFDLSTIIKQQPQINRSHSNSAEIVQSAVTSTNFKQEPVLEVTRKSSVPLLKDAKPFKRPQFVAKKPTPTATAKPNSPPTDPTPILPLNDLFDLPIQRPQISRETTITNSASSSAYSSSSSSSSSAIKFSNVHLFKSPTVASKSKSCLKIKDILFEPVRNEKESQIGASVIANPVFDLVVIDVEYLKVESCPDSPIINRKISTETTESKRIRAMSSLRSRLQAKKQQTMSVAERSKGGHLFELKNRIESKFAGVDKQHRTRLENLKLNKYYNILTKHPDVDNLTEFKFDLNHYQHLLDSYNLNGYIQTLDGGFLVPEEDKTIGIEQLFECFLDSNGVDCKLVDKTWFLNHAKWVIWKLSCYELRLGVNFGPQKILDPINVISQIKYRYDVEIGAAKRSCIKKVTEKDDTLMNKLAILFVSKVFITTANMIYIELSDGWYPIRALCDCNLSAHFKNNRVKVGDKLAVFSADLVGCPNDGCPPLEAPEQLHLRLSVNSTRRAKWFAKLGFVRPPRPLFVPIYSLKPHATVGAIDTFVERIYPILYVEKKEDGTKVYRNEKQEELLSYFQMDVRSGDYREDDGDGDLAPRRVDHKRDVTQIVRLRLVDVRKRNDKKITCLITIWNNAAEFSEKLNEGNRVQFFNLFASIQKIFLNENSTVFLNTTRQTIFKFFPTDSKSSLVDRLYSPRLLYEYSDFYESRVNTCYGEVDTLGVVIHHSVNQFQNLVFLTNLEPVNKSSIICLSFPKNSDYFGYVDVLKPLKSVVCLNLKYTRKKEFGKYPSLFVTESTFFTQKVQDRRFKFISEAFNRLTENSRILENKGEFSDFINTLEVDIKFTEERFKNGDFGKHPTESSSKKAQLEILNELSQDKRLADLPPLITKTGARFPGLRGSRVNEAKQFHTPTINRSVEMKNLKSNQMKRRSDISHDILRAKSIEDEDSFLLNQDLEALCKNVSASTTAATKRTKLD